MISSQQLGERIARARRQRELNQAEVAERLGVARTTIVAMEKGERRPDDRELVRLAAILDVTLNDLLREHSVMAEASPRFRFGPKGQEVKPGVRAAVVELRRLGSRYAELESLLDLRRTPAPLESLQIFRRGDAFVERAPKVAGEDAARTLRDVLSLGDGPALALEETLELEAGLRIFHLDLPAPLAAAFLWSDEIGACIALNVRHPYPRRRWSLAHELGHFLRDREVGDLLSERADFRRDSSEQFCEALAAELLLPAAGVRRRFTEHLRERADFTIADLLAMSHFYDVSFQAMALRIEELRLLPVGTYDNLKRRNFKPHEVEVELGLSRRQVTPQRFPPRYVRLACEAFERELLSEGELATYLGVNRLAAREIHDSQRHAELDQGETGDLDLGATLAHGV